MGWNGAGNFQRTNGSFSGSEVWQDDSSAGYDIVDARHDSHDQDLAQGINNCLTKDGQNSPTANLSMNSFKHTNVGDGTARNQYATVGQLQDQGVQALSLVGGTTTTITASMTPVISSYVTGGRYYFKAVNTNTGSTTLKIDSAPAVTIQLNGSALVSGEIVSGRYHTVIYDGTNFQLLNAAQESPLRWGGTTGGTATAFTIAPSPAIGGYAAGQRFSFTAHTASGAAPTLAVNGLTAKNIFDATTLTAIGANRLLSGKAYEVLYDGTQFRLLDNVGETQNGDYVWLGTTAGTATAQTASATPAITAYKAGQKFRMKIGAGLGSTGSTATAHTININSLGAKNIVNQDGTNPTTGTWVTGVILECTYDGTSFVITNDPSGVLSYTPTVVGSGGLTISSLTINEARYIKRGKTVTVWVDVSFTTGGTTNNTVSVSTPISSSGHSGTTILPALNFDGATVIGYVALAGANFTVIRDYTSAVWTLGSGRYARFSCSYVGV
jgi:hypothetical protein